MVVCINTPGVVGFCVVELFDVVEEATSVPTILNSSGLM